MKILLLAFRFPHSIGWTGCSRQRINVLCLEEVGSGVRFSVIDHACANDVAKDVQRCVETMNGLASFDPKTEHSGEEGRDTVRHSPGPRLQRCEALFVNDLAGRIRVASAL